MFRLPSTFLLLSILPLSANQLIVDPAGDNASARGTPDHPFKTISAAAAQAQPGDTVLVRDGLYRERVVPVTSGTPGAPITFRSEHPQRAIVRGSEVWRPTWTAFQKSQHIVFAAWDANLFGPDPNPFLLAYNEDWKAGPAAPARPQSASPFPLTLGQVFLAGRPLRQCTNLEDLELTPNSWMSAPDGSGLLAHFANQPAESIEITVRNRIFAPLQRGLAYITVEGFTFEHCANQLPSPDNGAVSTRSGHHWIIRDNLVRQAGTIGIEMGSEGWTVTAVEGEAPKATRIILAHHNLVEHNRVEYCGLTGIMGWNIANCVVRGNIVEHNNALGFSPARGVLVWCMAGIKLLGVKNVLVEGNLVRDNECFGIWIDNGYRNCRITRNVVFNNFRAGIFIELGLTHTPNNPADDALLDNNIVAGTRNGDGIYCHDSPGVTVAHNLIAENAGFGVRLRSISDRVAHLNASTEVLSEISDETIRNNIFSSNAGGAVCLPMPSARSQRVDCDSNLYLAGDWEPGGTKAPFFFENVNWADRHPGVTSADADRLMDRYREAMAKSPALPWLSPEHWKKAPWLSLDQWRLVSGWDSTSSEAGQPSVIVRAITPEVEFRGLDAKNTLPACQPVARVVSDFYGRPMPKNNARPGPFQSDSIVNRNTLGLWPVNEAAEASIDPQK